MTAPVGIAGLGVYRPERVMTAAELGERAGIPEEVVREKFGLREKRIAGEGEHVSDMAAEAGRRALEDASRRTGRTIDAGEIDAVVYFGSMYKDYRNWLAAPRIQHLVGAEQAWSFDLSGASAGGPVALRVAADLMGSRPDVELLLLAGASRESELLDYTNRRSRFMFNFGDGGGAALLERGRERNAILDSSIRTDGSFSEDVMVPVGGSRRPQTRETIEEGLHRLDVPDPESMKRRLDPVSLDRFVAVAREAVEASGHELADLDFLSVLHTKRSLHEALLERLGLDGEQTVYLDRWGHLSAVDPLIGLREGERTGKLDGSDGPALALALSAGTGYTWAATALRWGAP